MTPQEKAKELVDKFYWRETFFNVSFIDSKQCALIAVDEIIKNSFPGTIECYWQQVKQEIQAL